MATRRGRRAGAAAGQQQEEKKEEGQEQNQQGNGNGDGAGNGDDKLTPLQRQAKRAEERAAANALARKEAADKRRADKEAAGTASPADDMTSTQKLLKLKPVERQGFVPALDEEYDAGEEAEAGDVFVVLTHGKYETEEEAIEAAEAGETRFFNTSGQVFREWHSAFRQSRFVRILEDPKGFVGNYRPAPGDVIPGTEDEAGE